jgi:hypothetical protein
MVGLLVVMEPINLTILDIPGLVSLNIHVLDI